MKRIYYISHSAEKLGEEDVISLNDSFAKKNIDNRITGLLLYFDNLFFQIIEGNDDDIDQLFNKIAKDPRHHEVLRLKTENDVKERLFPEWSMRMINLQDVNDDIMKPIKILLQSLVESQSVIAQYTQPTIIKFINKGINPLNIPSISIDKIILFADLVSFSSITEKLNKKDLMLILNTYFDICSRIITQRSGEVNKFMGDGIMAYFNVKNADNALHACIDILREIKYLHMNVKSTSPLRLIKTGFGLSRGIVIEGNMGTSVKKDFTIIGDAVNTAARLESLTRVVKKSVLFNSAFKESTKESWPFLSLGLHNLKGKNVPEEIFTLDHELLNG